MKNKNMVLLALAIGCGLVAAFLTAKLGAGSKTDMVPVLVAAKNLDQGTKLDKIEEQFVRKPFPKESVPPDFIDDVSQLKDKFLQRSVRAGSHCTVADVTPRNTLELPVDPKTGTPYKAMALRVAPETIVGGLVLPGARVDVVSVERLTNNKTVANLILQNALVVAVDVNSVRPEDQGFIKNAQTVTLAVKMAEGMVLALAQKRGDVFLMLRDPNDKGINKNIKSLADSTAYDRNNEGNEGGEGSTVEKSKVLVAKATIPAGTKITDPAQYFTEMEWPTSGVGANFITKPEEIKDQVTAKEIAANVPPTKEAFKSDGAKVAPSVAGSGIFSAPKELGRHTITFQEGGSSPRYAHYYGGRLEDNSVNQPKPAPTNPAASQEIKPEKKEEKEDAPITD